jgi:sugar phosphate permease
MRWLIAIVLGLGIIINYFDRVNISVGEPLLAADFHLSAGQLGILFSSFLWSYAVMQLPVGILLDRIGVKWLIRVGTVLWGIVTLLTAVVSGFGLIILMRIILGVAEAPAFPGSSKATGYWFPRNERGLATSIFDAAAKFSNVIGVPIVAWTVFAYGWLAYRDPSKMSGHGLSTAEHEYIVEGGAQPEGEPSGNPIASLGYLLRQPKVWGLTIGFTAYGYSFYLLLTWLPAYLQTYLGMSVLKSG